MDTFPMIFRVKDSYSYADWRGALAVFDSPSSCGVYISGPMCGKSLCSSVVDIRVSSRIWEQVNNATVETSWGC